MFASLFFLYLLLALAFLAKDGFQFAIGVATYLVLTVLLIIELLLRALDHMDKDEIRQSDTSRLESDGTQLKAAAFYNSFDYIKQLESAKVDENLSSEFWDELTEYRDRGMFARDFDKAITGNADVIGKFINVTDGLRYTPGQPSDSVGKVHLFGGSTIFAYEVTDEHTPSALLQKQINETGSKKTVFNHGVGGSTLGDCLRRLKLLSLANNDIVLFLFGDNDIGINSPRKLVGSGFFKLIPFWGKLVLVFKSYSRVVKWIFYETVEYRFTDLETNPDLLKKTVEDYFQISDYLKNLEIRVCFLLQPNLYTKVPINEFEARLKATYPKHWERTVASGFKLLRDSLKDKADFLDISCVFDDKSGSYFLDWAHVNSSGNKIIASEMFKVLKNRELI